MNIDEIKVGQRLQATPGENEIGTVERIDHDEYVVWMWMPVPGYEDELVDIDPGDLEPA